MVSPISKGDSILINEMRPRARGPGLSVIHEENSDSSDEESGNVDAVEYSEDSICFIQQLEDDIPSEMRSATMLSHSDISKKLLNRWQVFDKL